MTRMLTILAAVAALAVSAAPVGSAATSKAKAPRFERAERATAFVWLAELQPVVTHKPKPPQVMGTRSGGDVLTINSKAKRPRPGIGTVSVRDHQGGQVSSSEVFELNM